MIDSVLSKSYDKVFGSSFESILSDPAGSVLGMARGFVTLDSAGLLASLIAGYVPYAAANMWSSDIRNAYYYDYNIQVANEIKHLADTNYIYNKTYYRWQVNTMAGMTASVATLPTIYYFGTGLAYSYRFVGEYVGYMNIVSAMEVASSLATGTASRQMAFEYIAHSRYIAQAERVAQAWKRMRLDQIIKQTTKPLTK